MKRFSIFLMIVSCSLVIGKTPPLSPTGNTVDISLLFDTLSIVFNKNTNYSNWQGLINTSFLIDNVSEQNDFEEQLIALISYFESIKPQGNTISNSELTALTGHLETISHYPYGIPIQSFKQLMIDLLKGAELSLYEEPNQDIVQGQLIAICNMISSTFEDTSNNRIAQIATQLLSFLSRGQKVMVANDIEQLLDFLCQLRI